MKTYQDFLKETKDGSENSRMKFVRACIDDYKNSELYETAVIADEYDQHKNKTINDYRKMLYTLSGNTVPDNFSANYKLASNFFSRFVSQQNQYLLGNGVSWNTDTADSTKKALGDDFDFQVQKAGRAAIVMAVSYGFWNLDHVDVFTAKEFAPLNDEENGALMAGVRFWQIDDTKPLRATLYEIDGYTDYIYRSGKDPEVLTEKRPYILHLETNNIDGTQIYDGENYETFPIVPCYCNGHHQSEFVGMREQIDAYDLIKSGFANDLDDCSQIYWTLQNAGGMNDADIALFVQRLKTVHVAQVDVDGASAESHTVDIPYAAREIILTRLEKDMYKDFGALNPEDIASGAVTATQIKAAYEPLNIKADQYEYCIIEFINGILKLAGIDDTPTFTRSAIVNSQETIGLVLSASSYLDEEYITKKVLDLLGDGDKAEDVLDRLTGENLSRLTNIQKKIDEGTQKLEQMNNAQTDTGGNVNE